MSARSQQHLLHVTPLAAAKGNVPLSDSHAAAYPKLTFTIPLSTQRLAVTNSKLQELTFKPAAVRWSCRETARLLYASLWSK